MFDDTQGALKGLRPRAAQISISLVRPMQGHIQDLTWVAEAATHAARTAALPFPTSSPLPTHLCGQTVLWEPLWTYLKSPKGRNPPCPYPPCSKACPVPSPPLLFSPLPAITAFLASQGRGSFKAALSYSSQAEQWLLQLGRAQWQQ